MRATGQSAVVASALAAGPTKPDAQPYDQLQGVVFRLATKVQNVDIIMGSMAARAGIATSGSGLRRNDPAWAAAVPALRPVFDTYMKLERELSSTADRAGRLQSDQRDTAVREHFASMFLMLIGRVFDQLDLNEYQKREAPRVVEGALRLLEAGS